MRPPANFSAGPGALPGPVRERLTELFGAPPDAPSLLEVSHRGPEFADVAERLMAALRRLMQLGDAHELLLMPGGAQLQFALLPMNLAGGARAGYIDSGYWSRAAIEQAERCTDVLVLASGAAGEYTALPTCTDVPTDLAYLHYCGNETIHGLQFDAPPASTLPLVADLSSEMLSRPYPFASLAGWYASAQKNLGIPGVTLVALRRDLLARASRTLPSIVQYSTWIKTQSMPNTPVTAAWIVALAVLEWIEAEGGLEAMAQRNRRKADTLYACLDRHPCFETPVRGAGRSTMNVVFRLRDRSREPSLLERAAREGFVGLAGHRAVGGLRASLYNAVEPAAVDALVGFLDDFAARS